MLMPPMKNNMPIWNTYANVAQVFLYLFDRGILVATLPGFFSFSAKEVWQSTARVR
jgi:hypothetical protein